MAEADSGNVPDGVKVDQVFLIEDDTGTASTAAKIAARVKSWNFIMFNVG